MLHTGAFPKQILIYKTGNKKIIMQHSLSFAVST